MKNHSPADVETASAQWLAHQHEITTSMIDAFCQYANENRNALKSEQAGSDLVDALFNQLSQFISDKSSDFQIKAFAAKLAKQGLALTTASQMMRVIFHLKFPCFGDF